MANRIPRRSATRIAAAVAVTAVICFLVTVMAGYRFSPTNSLPRDASQASQYSSLAYSGEDLWHAFPGR